jgi:general secretion pathway protein K
MKIVSRQRGVAVITALLLTTLAVTIVASLFWQQQVQVRSMENQRLHLQTKWILRGALDWARLVLRQDGMDTRTYTSLTAVWNTPLAETRLDQYIERERVEGEVFDASLSGRIIDASSRYNLTNLTAGPKIDTDQQAIFRRLLVNLQIEPVLAERTAKYVASAADTRTGAEADPNAPPVAARTTTPVMLTGLDDLQSIQGFTPQAIEKLRQYVIVLPEPTPLNVNTAPPELIAALVENFSVSQANALVERRKQAYYRQKTDFQQQLFGVQKFPDEKLYDVKSEYFLVLSRVRLDRAALDSEALVNRKLDDQTFKTTTVWVRQN